MAAVLTPDLQAILLNRLSAGELLKDILEHPGMPNRAAIMHLRKVNPDFAELFDMAKEMHADAVVERHFSRAIGEREQVSDASERLAWEAGKWYAGKIAPKRYGDKIQNEVTGADGAPLPVMIYLPSNGRDPVPASNETGDAEPE